MLLKRQINSFKLCRTLAEMEGFRRMSKYNFNTNTVKPETETVTYKNSHVNVVKCRWMTLVDLKCENVSFVK